MKKSTYLLALIFVCVLWANILQAAETPTTEDNTPNWPRFHGPKGDNHSPETGLLKQWPPEGPKLLWTVEKLGFGYSSVTVANDTIYTAGNIDERTAITAMDFDGKIRWTNKDCEAFVGHMLGTRATPTIDGDRLYHKTPLGDVICLNAITGKKIWMINILEKFNAENIQWALSESLLVDGDRVICSPCGPETAVVALDKMTGAVVWKSASAEGDPASYCSPILVEYEGLRIILTMTGKALIGVNADTGMLLFRFPHETTHDAAVANPVFHDGQVFISTGYGGGSVMVKLTVDGSDVTAEEVWRSRELDNHHGGVILVDGYLYGASDRFNGRRWICLDWKTGEMKYDEKGVGKGSATYAEGMLYTLSEMHDVGLVKATPDGHEVISEFEIPDLGKSTSRGHPVICGGRLYIRHNEYLFAYDVKAADEEVRYVVEPAVPSAQQLFPQGAVRLLPGPFKTMQDTDCAYLMRLEPDRLLAQFRVEAGLEPRAEPYGGWESPAKPGKTWSLAGHSLGHYLSALSLMYRITDDHRLKDRVAYIAKELKACQDKRGDGSLVAFPFARELEADIRAGKVETIDKYWAPFYTIHKELAGLRDAWLWCGDAIARETLIGLADWCGSLVEDLPEERRQRMLKMEHGGMAEVLADVYAITGDKTYLDYARFYSHHALLNPLADGTDNLTGMHANTQVPKFVGFQRIHELSGDARPGAAAEFFWETVVNHRTWVNGANSMHEHFSDPKTMGEHITREGGPETCNTHNMLKLTTALFREKPRAAYLDYYENALFNHILASQAPLVGGGAFVYYTPLRPGYARSYGTDFRSFWCCTGTGMENHAKYGELVYSHDGAALSVNLFLASELQWPERGLTLRQETRFPEEAGTTLVVTAAPAQPMAIRVRHPFWLASEKLQVRVNNKPVQVESEPGGFAELARTWAPGDRVRVELPMKLRVVRQPQCEGWVSLFHGPILLAGELGSEGLTQSDYIGRYTPIKALQPLEKSPVFIADTDEEILTHIAPLPGRHGTFRTTDLAKPNDVILSPFFRIHFQRYAIYWHLTDLGEWQTEQGAIAEAERLGRELDARTIDRVRIGEQQPEIDHNLLSQRSECGVGPLGKRWRHARDGGWFSYEMKLPPVGTKAAVRAMYWGRDGDRVFDIVIDGKVIATEEFKGDKDAYYGVEYPLADSLVTSKDKVTVRFQAPPDGTAGGVFDVRIVTVK